VAADGVAVPVSQIPAFAPVENRRQLEKLPHRINKLQASEKTMWH
jgi:hypothetical protein